jgi:cysteinyl-tRNA synthetase
VQSVGGDAARYVELLVETRQRLKAAKAFEIADWLRREIASRGVVLEDTASGPRWRFES